MSDELNPKITETPEISAMLRRYMTSLQCLQAMALRVAWYKASDQWQDAPTQAQLEARQNDPAYQAALQALRDHLRTCPACKTVTP